MIDWNKEFVVMTITRESLKDAGISKVEIASLTDEEMQRIADRIADSFFDGHFWELIEEQTRFIIESRGR